MLQLPPRTINNNNGRIVVTRLLPVPGEVLVQRGERVEALQAIARTELASRYQVIDIAHGLGLASVDMDEVFLKKQGDAVEATEVIAVKKGGLPMFWRRVRSPAAGHIAATGPGWVLLETGRSTTELQAFINGIVVKVIPDWGVVVEGSGPMIMAACGFGGEAYGPLKRLVNANFETVQAGALDERVDNSIILGGRTVDETILRAAEAAHVRGIVVGSIDAALMKLDPPVKVRVVATEGFGETPMSPYTFGVLATLTEKEVSIRGSTPILFPSGRHSFKTEPPLILASARRVGQNPLVESAAGQEIKAGSRVRVTQGPLLGANGTIASIPPEPKLTEAGLVAAGAYVTINNSPHFIPWANLEHVI
ncbi:MAG TPA: hypothetical protein VGD99_25275 [Anaerolineae bacterium]|jgi:transcription antitermination factor NusG